MAGPPNLKDCEGPRKYDIKAPNDPCNFFAYLTPARLHPTILQGTASTLVQSDKAYHYTKMKKQKNKEKKKKKKKKTEKAAKQNKTNNKTKNTTKQKQNKQKQNKTNQNKKVSFPAPGVVIINMIKILIKYQFTK